MVKAKDELVAADIHPNVNAKPPLTQPHPMNHNHILKPCNNHNHLHHHKIYHHYTYYHHYSAGQSEADVLSGGTGESTTPKFYFGPGFEPQTSGTCSVHDQANGGENKNSEYVVFFHVNPGVTISFQIGETTEVLRGEWN